MRDFIEIDLSIESLDIYYIRQAILQALQKSLVNLKGDLLDIGCGKMPYKNYILEHSNVSNYIGLDIETAKTYHETIKPDFTWDGSTMPFENDSFNCVIATEVLEHCPLPEVVLMEVYRVLKPGGVLFLTVPFLWNLHEVPFDEYRYTPFSMERHLKNSGFIDISLKATGGWHASMAQMLGLWVRRSPMSKKKRQLLSKVVKPIISYLIKLDKSEQVVFKEGQMITGLYGLVKK